jgi:hypothetical protein
MKKRWRATAVQDAARDTMIPEYAKRRGVRQSSGAFGKEMEKYKTPRFHFVTWL